MISDNKTDYFRSQVHNYTATALNWLALAPYILYYSRVQVHSRTSRHITRNARAQYACTGRPNSENAWP